MSCLFLTQHNTVTGSIVTFCNVPLVAATSRDGQTVAAVDWYGFNSGQVISAEFMDLVKQTLSVDVQAWRWLLLQVELQVGGHSPALQIEPPSVIGWLLPGEHDTGFFGRKPDTKQIIS